MPPEDTILFLRVTLLFPPPNKRSRSPFYLYLVYGFLHMGFPPGSPNPTHISLGVGQDLVAGWATRRGGDME